MGDCGRRGNGTREYLDQAKQWRASRCRRRELAKSERGQMLVPVEGADTARGRSQVEERGQDANGDIGEVEGVYIAQLFG
jgi:hypothetical protein